MQLDDNNIIITLNLTLAKTNILIGALVKQPFEQVAGLIQEIQQQAGPQVMEQQARANPAMSPRAPGAPEEPSKDAATGSLADKVQPL